MSEQHYNTLLSFRLNDEFFAIDAMKVNHILEVPDITHVPNTPEFLRGVINLHGNVIPVVDLRLMMGFDNADFSNDTAIVVIAPDEQQDSSLGVVVDMVKEVIEADGMEMKATVVDKEESMLKNFHGTLSVGDDFVHVIDIDELASESEV
ncbi:chemotaxis protein CheW [Marinilabilia rubra]|uniref:Chemotaxis protein CheW n=1 Tax=Marinilabilia rubra TaxID=2162893 RepID=A0A2U2B8P3_9BACT|nr:chemotaxis protein CheW [Marinilabilia rubra]PWD99413.1 chemotaxis protein CheW [Marinilabilia rubra]